MSKLPCKQCKSCGVYHDLSVTTCDDCGADLSTIPALLVETDEIACEAYGEINEEVTVFVQKCSACGALNFTADKETPVRVCYNCHKTRVASIEPTPYGVEEEKTPVEETPAAPTEENVKPTVLFDTDEDDDDDEEDSAQWQGILGNIRKSVGGAEPTPAKPAVAPAPQPVVDDDDDDDDDGADWSGILGGTAAPKAATVQKRPSITLTAIRYGLLSFTVEAKPDVQYMLGRSANQSKFLCNDGRVSNQHCYLYFQNGAWYVKDNHSANGTAVNSRDIGLDGESRLNDGDELKLGHHADSMAFKVMIG